MDCYFLGAEKKFKGDVPTSSGEIRLKIYGACTEIMKKNDRIVGQHAYRVVKM